VLGAADIGAPHKRDRIWIVAHRGQNGREHEADTEPSGDDTTRRTAGTWRRMSEPSGLCCGRLDADGDPWGNDPCKTKPGMVRMVDGVAYQVDRLCGLGNGQVPAVAALAFQVLSARIDSALANVQVQR
jgi:DNA (cytosine-5)-methyltransferase 1